MLVYKNISCKFHDVFCLKGFTILLWISIFWIRVDGSPSSGIEENEMGIGFSHRSLLYVSFVGFVSLGMVLGWVLYKSPNNHTSDEEVEDEDYDRQLDRADVATLNRAQRRARAKNRMKQKRRIAPTNNNNNNDVGGQNNDNDEPNNGEEEANQNGEGNELLLLEGEEEGTFTEVQQHLSRKERQKAAKALEKEERKRDQEFRKRQLIQEEKSKLEEKKKREELKEQQKQQALEKKAQLEKEQYYEWKYMFINPTQSTNADDDYLSLIWTVSKFSNFIKDEKIIDIHTMSKTLFVEPKELVQRMHQLQEERRLPLGMFTSDFTRFVYTSPSDIRAMVKFCKNENEGKVKISDMGQFLSQHILMNKKGEE